jgi:multimeric flavodoxin WrbA
MKVYVVSGSRSDRGQTAGAAQAFLDGATASGAEGATVFLPQMDIQRCKQCEDNGWGLCRTEGRCTIEDDFPSVVESIRGADVVVFANPVYFGDLSESLRAFLDRLRRTCMHEAGMEAVDGKFAVGICVAGGGGGGSPACALSMEKVLRTCGFDVVDLIPVRRQNMEIKLRVLEITGQWVAERAERMNHNPAAPEL